LKVKRKARPITTRIRRTHPPLAIFEVLDEEDRFSATMGKLRDYMQFGIENIWIIDPERRVA
jgi:Uma2 family endonuclease